MVMLMVLVLIVVVLFEHLLLATCYLLLLLLLLLLTYRYVGSYCLHGQPMATTTAMAYVGETSGLTL